jgi:hypothetical protein
VNLEIVAALLAKDDEGWIWNRGSIDRRKSYMEKYLEDKISGSGD